MRVVIGALDGVAVSKLSEIVAPGATVLVTDEQVTPATSGPHIDVINSEPPESAEPVAQ